MKMRWRLKIKKKEVAKFHALCVVRRLKLA